MRLWPVLLVLSTACGGSDPQCAGEVGHDEDGDGLDDGCDPCPFADDNLVDDDGDGITGICDPDPLARNVVLKFAGFGGDDPEITVVGGTVADDSFHVSRTGSGAAMWGAGLDRVHVMASVTVGDYEAAGLREVGLIVDGVAADGFPLPNGTYCALGKTGMNDMIIDHFEVRARERPAADTVITTNRPVLTLPGLQDALVQVFHTLGGDPSSDCAFGVPLNRALLSGTRTPAPPAGQVGVFGFAADADFAFLFVVGQE